MSIAQLITHLYSSTEGEIVIDNCILKELNLYYLRKSIGYAPEKSFLFFDSIYDNIALSRTFHSSQEVTNAIKNPIISNVITNHRRQKNWQDKKNSLGLSDEALKIP